jgi:signal transduction histidine kinase
VLAALLALAATLLMGLVASRVAGHLSRNLSRPLSELVGWTAMIGRGEPLPAGPPRKGAPEFVVLRNRMREMSDELHLGRTRALEAERTMALREAARHVLETESQRLDEMARSFAQFGRLPEGPQAPVDLAELVRACTRSAVPAGTPLAIQVDEDVPMVPGHAEALGRALTNVLLNAVESGPPGSPIAVSVRRAVAPGQRSMVEIEVRDSGAGIPASKLERIWEPYVTHKPGGTGLGLAIVRQTVHAHGGTTSAESTPGVGTTIRLALPIDAVERVDLASAGREG